MDVLQNKNWNTGTVQVHVEPPTIPLIKSKKDDKSDKYFIKVKLRRSPTSEKSDFYEFKVALSDNSKPEEFLLFIWGFKITLKASETIKSGCLYL